MGTIKMLLKTVRLVILPVAALSHAAATAGSSTLTPIVPSVDHSKKATCGIKWTFDRRQPIKRFKIFRGATGDFWSADCIAEVGNTIDRFTDWGAAQYQNYFYWVVPYDYNASDRAVYDSPVLQYWTPSDCCCQNHRYWGASDVYLAATAKTMSVGSVLPLYFKVNSGTSSDPLYDHVMPDTVVFTGMTDLDGNETSDIATVFGNRMEVTSGGLTGASMVYSGPESTYLKGNGSFGCLVAHKPGILYLRAYYKSATTASPLRIEIKQPTFKLYAPEGDIDIVENNYRDLYLKCNGKFVCPDVERTSGDSATIWPVSLVETTDESQLQDGLYDNSFGFLNMTSCDCTTEFYISYNDMFVKRYRVSPMWDPGRSLKLVYWESDGTSATPPFAVDKTYYFGVAYGERLFPHEISICGSERFTSPDWGVDGATAGPQGFAAFDEPFALFGELGSFSSPTPGKAILSVRILDRRVTDDTISFHSISHLAAKRRTGGTDNNQ